MKKINLSFFILLIFLVQVLFSDIIIYFTGMRYIFANIIGLVLNIACILVIIKKNLIKIKIDFNKWDLIFLGILLILIVMTIIFPDTFYDSYSYHLYMQQKPFSDKINDDFFPGRTLTSFVFPIIDRIYYMFRLLLGFRLGTLPGYLILVVIYYEIKKILKKLIDPNTKKIYLSILSMIPLGAFIILEQLGTYYIDNFLIAILLEFTYIILYEKNDIFKEKVRLYYLAFIVGVSVCIKITSTVYMFLPLIYLLIVNIKNIKQIKWYDYILLVFLAILPVFPYMLNTIIQTGSPVFPYYNAIFKSEYFKNENWLDKRYGPQNILQFLIWPLYIIQNPQKAYERRKY